MGVVIYMCMEATQGISLYSFFISNYQKCHGFFYYLFFSSTKSENKMVEQVLPTTGERDGGWPK
jgi:hypothetical protein